MQFVALSCSLSTCCVYSMVRDEEGKHCIVLEMDVFQFCNTQLLKKSLFENLIVQLKPEHCNYVPVPSDAVPSVSIFL